MNKTGAAAIQARFSAPELAEIEDFRRAQPRIPPLADALRTLVRIGLEAARNKPAHQSEQMSPPKAATS